MGDLFNEDEPRGALSGRYAQVALEQGIDSHPEGLTYAVPEDLADLTAGDRVIVPLGRRDRKVSGYVLQIATKTELDAAKLKPVLARDRGAVNLPEELVELARWISRYYCCPLGMVFVTMLPAAVKHGTGLIKRRMVELHDPIAADALPSVIEHHQLRGKQADVLGKAVEMTVQGHSPMDPKALARAAGARTISPVQGLIEKDLLRVVTKSQIRAAWTEHAVEAPKDLVLTGAQRRALAAVVESAGKFHVHLLHGVTDSGKTEVYIRAIEQAVARGQSAIVLVPEIALTPQTVGRFLGRFDNVAVLHSGLTAAQRHEQWVLIRQGWANVVVGARSAIFAPVQNLGLIVVDEEHDSSYKQDQAPRYHGRDVAVKRAQLADIPIVLGSATPSLESHYNATVRNTYHLLTLPDRVAERQPPKVEIVDMSEERRKRYAWTGKGGVHLLSMRLETALRQTFEAGGQAMLLLNRRGYANYISCPDQRCGWMMRCEYCDVAMVYHVDKQLPAGGLLRCHYCSFENRLPKLCPICGRKVTVFGLGTQRVEEEVANKFPGLSMMRMDSDVMRTMRDYEQTLGAFRSGKVKLLLGTQMIAKGLDFPNVRIVGVISADTALNLPDFRSSERTFQLIAQVAGRSGRGPHGGRVIVQTFTPDHPSIQLASNHDYQGFAAQELESRQRYALPPVTRMARIIVRDAQFERAERAAHELATLLNEQNEQVGVGATLYGPTPPPIARIGGYHRQEIQIIADAPTALQRLLTAARTAGHLTSDARTAVDVDPISLM